MANDKILDLFKFKAFAGNKINVNQILKFDFERLENIVGKGENAGNGQFFSNTTEQQQLRIRCEYINKFDFSTKHYTRFLK